MHIIPLKHILRKAKASTPSEEERKLTISVYGRLKLYGKNENEIKGLVSTVQIFSQDKGMEFRIKKCGVIIMN